MATTSCRATCSAATASAEPAPQPAPEPEPDPEPAPEPEPEPEPEPDPEPAPSDNKGAAIVATAKKYLGVRYVYGGASPSGFDCSGFTMYLYRQFGYSLPHTASGQYANCGYKVSRSELQPGDLVFFTSSGNGGRINHVGVYIGGDQVIHARFSIGKVYINSLSETYYNKNYVGAIRIA